MALADSVPGVSGGSIAYIMGFYDKFITSLDDIFKGNKKEKIEALKFLLKLGIGWIIGMALSVSLLASLFDKEIYKMSSLFLGFIIASIPIMFKEEKKFIKGKYKNIIWLIIGIIAVVVLSSFKLGANLDLSHITFGMAIYIFLAGALAISAMVLPGISGSTLLFAFGLYLPVISGIKALLHLDFSSFTLLFILGLGILFGIFAVIGGIKKLLETNRSVMVYLILGMMIGSIYAIVIGPTTLSTPKDALSFDTFSILFFIIGVAIVVLFEQVKKLPSYKEQIKKEK